MRKVCRACGKNKPWIKMVIDLGSDFHVGGICKKCSNKGAKKGDFLKK